MEYLLYCLGNRQQPFEQALDHIAESGLQAIEIGVGGYVGNAHCNPVEFLENEQKLENFKKAVEQRGLEISALSCHGNALHPNKELAKKFHEDFQNAVRLAAKLNVQNVVTFSGCPGESENSKHPV